MSIVEIMAKKYYNKMLPRKPKKCKLTTTQKVAYSFMSAVVLLYVLPDVATQLYNYVNRADSTEIKLPQKGDLFPNNGEVDEENKQQDQIDEQNKNYAYNFLKDTIRPQIEQKLGFEIEGDFDVLGVFETNMRSDAFSSKDTQLKILIKPENGKVFCVVYNNNFAQIDIEQEGSDSDGVSSLVAHLQGSSIQSIEINTEFFEDVMKNLSEEGIVFVGTVQTFIEKNGEKSYMMPVFFQKEGQLFMKTFKGLQSEIDKLGQTPEIELANTLYGDEGTLMQEYSNQNQRDFTHLNNILNRIKNNESGEKEENSELYPDDYFSDEEQGFALS